MSTATAARHLEVLFAQLDPDVLGLVDSPSPGAVSGSPEAWRMAMAMMREAHPLPQPPVSQAQTGLPDLGLRRTSATRMTPLWGA